MDCRPGDGFGTAGLNVQGMTPTLTVSSLTDLVEITPSLLGFRPADSLVAVVCEDGVVVVTARVDLRPGGPPGPTVAALRTLWERYANGTFTLVAFSEDAATAWDALAAVDAALPSDTMRLLVHADTRRWYASPDDEGVPYDARAGRLGAAAAVAGLAVLDSREDLYALLAPVVTEPEADAATERVLDRYPTSAALVRAALALLDDADAGDLVVDADTAAALGVATRYADFVDPALLSTTRANADARRDLWAAVVRHLCPCCAGMALTALGLACWLCGQGAMQVVCLDLLARADADPVWAEFVSAVNLRALPPEAWDDIRAGGMDAVARQGSAA